MATRGVTISAMVALGAGREPRSALFLCLGEGEAMAQFDYYASFMVTTALLGQLDQRAKARGQNRSEALREALQVWLQATANSTLPRPQEPEHAA
jgi:hypothetical protein